MTVQATLDVLRSDDPPTIREILSGRRPLRVPVAITVRKEHPVDLEDLTVDEIVEQAVENRKKHKGLTFDLEVIASTSNLVRDDAIIPTAAWDITDFLKNPVILFAHNSFMPPIARSVSTELRRGPGEMRQFWLFNDLTQLSREIHAMFETGAMRAASVGFMIRSFHRPDEVELKKLRKKFPRAGEFTWVIDLAELLETSAVPVPADPGAIALQGVSLEEDLQAVYAEMGLRGPGESEVFSFGLRADELLVETRQHWAATVRVLADECARGNEAACACLTQEVDDVTNQSEKPTFAQLAAKLARIDRTHQTDAARVEAADEITAAMKDGYDLEAPDQTAVQLMVTTVENMLRDHGDETSAFYRTALRLALGNDVLLIRLGGGVSGGEGFHIILDEARWRAGFGPDPLVEREPEQGGGGSEDDEIRLVDMNGDEMEIVDDE